MDQLTAAIVLWTGHGRTGGPSRDADMILRTYGSEVGRALLKQIAETEEDFHRSDAHSQVADLVEMGERAATEFRASRPEVGEQAVRALTWCYSFDYR